MRVGWSRRKNYNKERESYVGSHCHQTIHSDHEVHYSQFVTARIHEIAKAKENLEKMDGGPSVVR